MSNVLDDIFNDVEPTTPKKPAKPKKRDPLAEAFDAVAPPPAPEPEKTLEPVVAQKTLGPAPVAPAPQPAPPPQPELPPEVGTLPSAAPIDAAPTRKFPGAATGAERRKFLLRGAKVDGEGLGETALRAPSQILEGLPEFRPEMRLTGDSKPEEVGKRYDDQYKDYLKQIRKLNPARSEELEKFQQESEERIVSAALDYVNVGKSDGSVDEDVLSGKFDDLLESGMTPREKQGLVSAIRTLGESWKKAGMQEVVEAGFRTSPLASPRVLSGDREIDLGELLRDPEKKAVFNLAVQHSTNPEDRGVIREFMEGAARGAGRIIRAGRFLGESAAILPEFVSGKTPEDDPFARFAAEERGTQIASGKDQLGISGQVGELVPFAATVGVGGPLAGMYAEAPAIAVELDEAGVAPEIAAPVAVLTGLGKSMLERAQLGSALGRSKAANFLASKLKSRITRVLTGMATRTIEETGMEALQEGFQSIMVDAAQHADPDISGPEGQQMLQNALDSMGQTVVQAGGPFAVVAALGLPADLSARTQQTQAAPQIPNFQQLQFERGQGPLLGPSVQQQQLQDIDRQLASVPGEGLEVDQGLERVRELQKQRELIEPKPLPAKTAARAIETARERGPQLPAEVAGRAVEKARGRRDVRVAEKRATTEKSLEKQAKTLDEVVKNKALPADFREAAQERATEVRRELAGARQAVEKAVPAEAAVEAPEKTFEKPTAEKAAKKQAGLKRVPRGVPIGAPGPGLREARRDVTEVLQKPLDETIEELKKLPESRDPFAEARKRAPKSLLAGAPIGGGIPSATPEAPAAPAKPVKAPTNPQVVKMMKSLRKLLVTPANVKSVIREATDGLKSKATDLTAQERNRVLELAVKKRSELEAELKKKATPAQREQTGLREPQDIEVQRQAEAKKAALKDVVRLHPPKAKTLEKRAPGVRESQAKTIPERVARTVRRIVTTNNADAVTLTEHIFGRKSKVNEAIVERGYDTVDRHHQLQGAWEGNLRKAFKDVGLTEKDVKAISSGVRGVTKAPTAKVELSNGTLTGTWSDIADAYWMTTDKESQDSLAEHGYGFESGRPLKITPADAVVLRDALQKNQPKLLKLLDAFNRINREIIFPEIQKVNFRLGGEDLTANPTYVPRSVMRKFLESAEAQEQTPEAQEEAFLQELVRQQLGKAPAKGKKAKARALPRAITSKPGEKGFGDESFLQERKGGRPLQGMDFIARQIKHMADVANYAAKAEYVRDMKALLRDVDVRDAVSDSVNDGDFKLTQIWDAVRDFGQLNRTPRGATNRAYNWLVKNFTRAAIGAKPQVMLYQVPSAIYAGGELGFNNVAKAALMGRKTRSQTKAEIEKWSPTLSARTQGTGSRIGTLGLTETNKDAIRGSLGYSADWRDRLAYGGIHAMDTEVVYRIWHAAKLQAESEGFSGDDLMRETNRRARRTVNRTQPDWNFLAQSKLQRDAKQDKIKKMLAMFTSQTGRVANMAMRAVDAYSRGDISGKQMLAETVPAMIGGPILIELIQKGVFTGFGALAGQTEEDRKKYERSWPEAVAAVLSRAFSGFVVPAKLVDFVVDRVSAKGPMDTPRLPLPIQASIDIGKAITATKEYIARTLGMVKHKKTGEPLPPNHAKFISQLMKGTSDFFGIPMRGVEQILRPQLQKRLQEKRKNSGKVLR
jgi:hypothetical protein